MQEISDLTYPQKLLRGISSQDFIEKKVVLHTAFAFDEPRDDGFCEMSITWYDDEKALQTIKKQRKADGSIQFKAGIAEIDRIQMKQVMNSHFLEKRLSYERRKTQGNPYHGNLLISKDVSRQLRRLICFGLATLAGNNIYQNDEE